MFDQTDARQPFILHVLGRKYENMWTDMDLQSSWGFKIRRYRSRKILLQWILKYSKFQVFQFKFSINTNICGQQWHVEHILDPTHGHKILMNHFVEGVEGNFNRKRSNFHNKMWQHRLWGVFGTGFRFPQVVLGYTALPPTPCLAVDIIQWDSEKLQTGTKMA